MCRANIASWRTCPNGFSVGGAMDDLQTMAALCMKDAELMRTAGLIERDMERRRVMLAIAEHYFLLHDELLELERLLLPAGPGLIGQAGANN